MPKNEAVEFVKNSENGLAKEECQDASQAKEQTVKFVENTKHPTQNTLYFAF